MLAAVPLVVLPLFMVPWTVTTMPSCRAVSDPLDRPSTVILAPELLYSTPLTMTLPNREMVPTAITPLLLTGGPLLLPVPLAFLPVPPLTIRSPRRQPARVKVRESAARNQERRRIVMVQ